MSKISNALKEPIDHLGCFSSLPESTLQEKLLKAILLHGHTKIQAAHTMNVSPKTIYNFLKKGHYKKETLKIFSQYMSEIF